MPTAGDPPLTSECETILSPTLKMPPCLYITTEKLADGAITTAKMADGTITTNKLNNNSITTSKIQSNSITLDKISQDVINYIKNNY